MNLKHIVALIVRLFSMVIAIYALQKGVTDAPYFYQQGWHITSYAFVSLMLLLVLIAIYLWLFPLTVTNKLLSFQKYSGTESQSVSYEQFQFVAFTLLGIYLLFNVVSDVIYWATILFISFRDSNIPIELSLDQKGQIVATAIELIFVLFLLLSTNGIVKLLHKIRYGKNQ
jgi:hypothetical protein